MDIDTTTRPKLRARLIAGTAALTLAIGLAATPATGQATTPISSTASADWRGDVTWVQHQGSLSTAKTRTTLQHAEFGTSDVHNGVDLYRVVYRTPSATGRPTKASGLVALPRTKSTRVRTVYFGHGTVSYRADAPSMLPDDLFASAPSISYASAGFASVAPDYLGLGLGRGTHPWFDVPSETTASIDLLRAARTVAKQHGRTLERGVLATGFSQGASAALGVGRALERGADPYFRLRALAPVSGAYDVRHEELPALGTGAIAPPNDVAYVTYLLVAYNRLHHLYRDPSEVFRSPYADRVGTLFNSNTPGEDMITALPKSVDQLLTARGRAMLAHPTGRFAAALAEADTVCMWTPHVPVRLYYAKGDEQVVNGNTPSCNRSLTTRGADVHSVRVDGPDYARSRHLGSGIAGTTATLRWFERLS